MRQVRLRTGLSRSTIYLKMKNGEFPTQVSLGPRAVGWLEAEVDRWIASRVDLSRDVNHAEQASTGGSRASK